jgi:glycosyltransferase involved in cell wall biosynthesis
MKKLLIYCTNTGGHRQIYCNVLAEWALSRGYYVYLVYGGTFIYEGYKVNNQLTEIVSPYIEYYENAENIKLINLLDELNNIQEDEEFEFLARLQKDLDIDVTLLPDGMIYIDRLYELSRKKRSRKEKLFYSKTICFNLDTAFCYLGIIKKFLGIRNLKKIKDIDKCIIFDEFLYRKINSARFGYVPDMAASFNVNDDKTYDKKIMENYRKFCKTNNSKEIIFYFGPANKRKGYDLLIKSVLKNKNVVFVHCGEIVQQFKDNIELNNIIRKLKSENRIFIHEKFITSSKMISEFFNSINFYVSGHRDHYLSSGTMIQALLHNKPLIVPNIGLMARRVKENNLGLVYEQDSIDDLSQNIIFMSKGYKRYLNAVKNYKNNFSRTSIFRWLDKSIEYDKKKF